jgi:hypothetical protein
VVCIAGEHGQSEGSCGIGFDGLGTNTRNVAVFGCVEQTGGTGFDVVVVAECLSNVTEGKVEGGSMGTAVVGITVGIVKDGLSCRLLLGAGERIGKGCRHSGQRPS